MASRGAATPVHCSKASAAWCTSIPRPPTVGAPTARAAPQERRLESGGTRGRRSTGRAPARPATVGVVAHPDRRRVHHDLGARPGRAGRPVGGPDPGHRRDERVPGLGAARRDLHRAPRPTSAAATARAAPPAPSRSTERPAGSSPASASERRNPSPSVESPSSVPSSRTTTVLTDASAAAAGRQLVAGRRGRIGLVRHRDAEAAESERRRRAHRVGTRVPARPRARRTPSRARPRRTRRCGWPATASAAPASR